MRKNVHNQIYEYAIDHENEKFKPPHREHLLRNKFQ